MSPSLNWLAVGSPAFGSFGCSSPRNSGVQTSRKSTRTRHDFLIDYSLLYRSGKALFEREHFHFVGHRGLGDIADRIRIPLHVSNDLRFRRLPHGGVLLPGTDLL